MSNRRTIQQAHERFHVDTFLKWFNNAYHCDYRVVAEPNPPEAIIRSRNKTSWIEVSTAFWNAEYARDLYSDATPEEEHKPVGTGPFVGMDAEFSKSFVKVLKNKLEKQSYVPSRDSYGQGYLLVPIKHLWLSAHTIREMRQEWEACTLNNLQCFRSIYIAFQSMGNIRYKRWPNYKD